MFAPPMPPDEARRIESLRSLLILDTPPEKRFDNLTHAALCFFRVEIALVSLVDSNRQWFKSACGLDATETGRDISFCGHAILADEVFVIEDAARDSRFADNPLVIGPPFIRFYAGAPLKMRDGQNVGTLCLIDPKPRTMSADEIQMLSDMAKLVAVELQRPAA